MTNVYYIAGPFRAATPWEQEQNVRRAEAVSLALWQEGIPNVCPHTMCRHFQDSAPDAVWLNGMLAIMRKCDGVIVLPGASKGTEAEVAEATALGIPIAYMDV